MHNTGTGKSPKQDFVFISFNLFKNLNKKIARNYPQILEKIDAKYTSIPRLFLALMIFLILIA